MKFIKIVILIILVSCPAFAQDTNGLTAVFNQNLLKALVSIEIFENSKKSTPIGSGFLVSTPNKHIALVTAKHVILENQNKESLKKNLAFRLNDKKEKSSIILNNDVNSILKSGWIFHDKLDIACRLIVRKETTDFIPIPFSMFLPTENIQAGAPLFIIGFPLGLRSEEYATPILRRGMIARIDTNNLIVDGFIFPGNSGGPVVYGSAIQFGKGITTHILQGFWLVGMVISYIPYNDTAISIQTKQPRIIFQENSGLCNVIPAEHILNILKSPEFTKIDKSF